MSELRAEHAVALQFLINEDLYLVDPLEQIVSVKTAPETGKTELSSPLSDTEIVAFDYLGENNKYFAILVNYEGHQYMAPKELEALQSILSAKKMELKDVALVNLNKYPAASFHQLKSFLACNRIVLFGINPQTLQLPSIASNQIGEHEGVKVLATYAFGEMMNDVEKKKAFWAVMKGF